MEAGPLRIAMVSKSVYPTRGGVELHVHNLAKQLSLNGHVVDVFISGKRPAPDQHYSVHEQTSFTRLISELRHQKFDVLHAHGARDPLAALALTAGRRAGLQTIFTPHCFYPPRNTAGRVKRMLFDTTIGKKSLQSSRWIVCLTEQGREDASRQPGAELSRLCVVPNSICWPKEPNTELVRSLEGEHGPFLLCVGRLDAVKGGDFLIKAMGGLPDELRLIFVGPDSGAYLPWKKLAERLGMGRRVQFLMELDDEALLAAYRAARAVVMASSYEGLPTVLLEAMAIGTPVIAADRGGVGHLIRHEENGLLFPMGDMIRFVRSVTRIPGNCTAAMVERAQQHVRLNYTWDKNVGRIASLYRCADN